MRGSRAREDAREGASHVGETEAGGASGCARGGRGSRGGGGGGGGPSPSLAFSPSLCVRGRSHRVTKTPARPVRGA